MEKFASDKCLVCKHGMLQGKFTSYMRFCSEHYSQEIDSCNLVSRDVFIGKKYIISRFFNIQISLVSLINDIDDDMRSKQFSYIVFPDVCLIQNIDDLVENLLILS